MTAFWVRIALTVLFVLWLERGMGRRRERLAEGQNV